MTLPHSHRHLLARAALARRLIRDNRIDPDIALSYVIWPTPRMLEAEARCPVETHRSRAYELAA